MGIIYQLKENINNRIYIGSTLNFERRKMKHLYDLKNNKHHNIYLQRIFNKNIDFQNLITFKILEKFEDDTLQFNKESLWINKLNPELNIGSVGGGDNLSLNPNRLEIITKIQTSMNLKYSLLTKEDKVKIYGKPGYLNGNWKGGISKSYCFCGNLKSSKHNATCINCKNMSGVNNPFYNKTHSQETKNKISKGHLGKKPINSLKVIIDDKVYFSATDASKKIGCCVSTILNRCKSEKFFNYNFLSCLTTIESIRLIPEEASRVGIK